MNKNTVFFWIIILMLIITSVFSINLFIKKRLERDSLDITVFPYEVGSHKGEDIKITEKEYEILETRNLIMREYTNDRQEKISIFIIYSETNRSIIHPPEVCLLGSGVDIEAKTTDTLDLGDRSLRINRMYTKKGSQKDLILYTYKSGDFYTDSFYLQQISFAYNQLLNRNKGGAIIRVSTPLAPNEKSALIRLKDFMGKAIRIMEKL